jgi:hypothetical protein
MQRAPRPGEVRVRELEAARVGVRRAGEDGARRRLRSLPRQRELEEAVSLKKPSAPLVDDLQLRLHAPRRHDARREREVLTHGELDRSELEQCCREAGLSAELDRALSDLR